MPTVALPGKAAAAPAATSPPPAAPQQTLTPVIDVGPSHNPAAAPGQPGSELAPSAVGTAGKGGGAPTQKADTSWMDAMPSVSLPKDQAQSAPPPTQQAATPQQQPAQQSTLRGIGRNIGAGAVDAGAAAINTAADPFGNLVGKPLATGLVFAHDAIAPWFGGQKFPDDVRNMLLGDNVPQQGTATMDAAAHVIGATPPSQVQANGPAEQFARKATTNALLMGAGGGPTAALAGAAGAATGDVAAQAAPDWAKPAAELAGNVVGGVATGAVASGIGGAVGAGARQVGNLVKPLTNAGRQQLAGQRIADAASDLGAVKESLNNPAPPLVPGSEPTTFQATGDQGLGNLERVAAKNAPDQFLARSNQQNAARVQALDAQQPTGDPYAVGQSFVGQLQAMDKANEAEAAGYQQKAQGAAQDLGNAPPVGADAQASALQGFGNTIRGKLNTANQAWKASNSELYNAVDPDGNLTVDMQPFRQQVAQIVGDRPKNLGPMQGEAGAVFGTAQMQPAVQSFSEVGALRQRIGDAAAAEMRQNGSSQTYRYLTMLRGALDNTLSGAVAEKAAADAGLVNSGAMAPENATAARLAKQVADGQPANAAGDNRGNGGVLGNAGSADAIPPGAGKQIPPGGQPPNAGGNGNLSAQAADLTPLKGSNRKPETLQDFLIWKGGVKDQGGELTSQDLDRIHYRMGGRLVNNTKGMPLDYAREAAIEEGFLPANADINDLKDALQSKTPVYRISEAADAHRAQQDALNARLNDEARYNSRDAVASSFDAAGVRPSPAELDHATDLHMQGVHPDEAARQATEVTADRVLQRNAEYNNIGSPGVPPAARQASMGTDAPVAATFDQAALARRRIADAAHAERMQTFGPNVPGVGPVLRPAARAGDFKMGASEVPANLFMPGKGAAERIQAFQRAAQRDPSMMNDLQDYAAFSFRRAAEDPDGTINPAKAQKWNNAHSEVMGAFPELAAKFDNAVSARQALDDVTARQAADRKTYQTSAVSRLMGDADPVKTVGRVLGSDNAVAQMRDLARKTAGDPDARAGLRRAVVEHVLDNLRSNALAGTERSLKNDAFQTFARNAGPALRTVFSADEVQTIRNVAADLQRSQKSVSGTKLPGGSNTAQDLAAGAKHGGHSSSIMGTIVGSEIGGELMGHLTGGIGRVAGMVLIPVANAMRAHGMTKVNDLVTEAMLNPALAKSLLAKVPDSPSSGRAMGRVIATQIAALGPTSDQRKDR